MSQTEERVPFVFKSKIHPFKLLNEGLEAFRIGVELLKREDVPEFESPEREVLFNYCQKFNDLVAELGILAQRKPDVPED